ncbi:MAG TPA: arsinothricin resistance N-acetyltransferase ArsN1 family B [Bdellovibrionota bacterium]|jgi:phosphinothricin acetyltransferase|nr:arsinothricin resistance N-acetyltransferase ArsN1 family B [Bdellovibrionota bacterium]
MLGVLRLATEADAEAMLAIYAPHVERSAVSFEWELPSLAEFRGRIRDTLRDYPWFVATDETGVTGYAYAARYRTRTAYQWSVETTIYLRPDRQGRGTGRALYERLLATLRKQGIRLAYGVIALPNEASVRFHEALGFKAFALYPQAGFKLGHWHDVGWWRKELVELGNEPAPPVPFKDLEF